MSPLLDIHDFCLSTLWFA